MDSLWNSYRRTERKAIRKARSPGSAFFIMVVVVAALAAYNNQNPGSVALYRK